MDNVIKNYEEVLAKPPSTRLYLSFLLHKFKTNIRYRFKNKKNIEDKTEVQPENIPPKGIEVVSFAVVVNDVVIDIMNVQKEFGNVLQQNPDFIFIEDGTHRPQPGWIYKDGKFVTIEDLTHESRPTLRS